MQATVTFTIDQLLDLARLAPNDLRLQFVDAMLAIKAGKRPTPFMGLSGPPEDAEQAIASILFRALNGMLESGDAQDPDRDALTANQRDVLAALAYLEQRKPNDGSGVDLRIGDDGRVRTAFETAEQRRERMLRWAAKQWEPVTAALGLVRDCPPHRAALAVERIRAEMADARRTICAWCPEADPGRVTLWDALHLFEVDVMRPLAEMLGLDEPSSDLAAAIARERRIAENDDRAVRFGERVLALIDDEAHVDACGDRVAVRSVDGDEIGSGRTADAAILSALRIHLSWLRSRAESLEKIRSALQMAIR